MGGDNGPQLGVTIDLLVPIRFHVTCIQSSVMYTKIRSAPSPPTSLHSDVTEVKCSLERTYSIAVDLLSKTICVVFLFILVG